MPEVFQDLEWKSLLLGSETWSFLFEAFLRTIAMFLVILIGLRMLGKRGVKQLSVFELGVIIGLGSAAGDPMFYKDVGLLAGVLVFTIVVGLYRLLAFLINRSDAFEKFVEGIPREIVLEGKILVHNFKREPFARDELFSQLRMNNVSHLGQVREVILETNGEISIYFAPEDEVKYGLPIIPRLCEKKLTVIPTPGIYSCLQCGYTDRLLPANEVACPECKKKEWVKSINEQRIS